MMRASHSQARDYLDWAQAAGHIKGYERIEFPTGNRTGWKIKVLPTRYDTYHKTMDNDVIVLTSREVMAFIEGVWAGAGIHPTTRAGDSVGPAARHRMRQEQG
jgi:hypothetical protein